MSGALYHDALVEAAKSAFGAGRLERPAASVTCDNPLCGDRITLDLEVEGGRVGALAHRTRGCLLTQAAASVVARVASDADASRVQMAAAEIRALLADGVPPSLPELSIFAPVRDVRSRHMCVLLAFDALTQAWAAVDGDR